MHRHCAGLSKTSFTSVSTSNQLFHCPRCLLQFQSKELATLKKTLEALTTEVPELKSSYVSIRRLCLLSPISLLILKQWLL